MTALPLTLDTSQSTTPSPLMSPHMGTLGSPIIEPTANQRPSVLTLLEERQPQHSKVSPTSEIATAAALGNISPALSSVSSLSPSFLPEMPQWKRDLIQRRKQNVQRTISASSSTSSPQSASPSITSNLKNFTSSTSMCSLAGSNVNIDQVATDISHSPTKDFNKLSTPIDLAEITAITTTTKVNKYATATPATAIKATTTSSAAATAGKTTTAITITSPNKEKKAKSFGGQYTAIAATRTDAVPTSAQTTPSPSPAATVNTKEEQTQEEEEEAEISRQDITMEEEYLEKSKKTKEYAHSSSNPTKIMKTLIGEEDEDVHNNITTSSAIKHQHQQQQQTATRLTGSSSYNNTNTTSSSLLSKREIISSSSSSSSVEREQSYQQQYHNITGANNSSANQSSSKCESERVCAADNNSASSSVVTVVKISQKLKDNQFIKNEQQYKTKIIKPLKNLSVVTSSVNLNSSSDFKSPTKTAAGISASSSSNCAIKKKMVAMQEMKKSTCSATNNASANSRNSRVGGVTSSNDLDSNEDLSYGPGIVSKLRCRYLSLALRESMEQQRLNKDLLRRSTSLNNLLDDDDPAEEDDDEEEEEDNVGNVGVGDDEGQHPKITTENFSQKKTGILKNSCSSQEKRFAQGSNGVGVTFTETSSFSKRSRHLKRGNDSLKRARSVEALLSEKSPWQGQRSNAASTCVTIEDKIQNARERLHQGTDHMPPKRLTSIIDDTERPPPDLVKQTLKMFEATANRRPRCTNRSNSKGDVASKVEAFKNIIKDQKPVVNYPKPVSPTKKLNTPNVVKSSLKSSTQASDLLHSPLGRKTMAAANLDKSAATANTLSEHTPDIIPRQKIQSERELSKEKYTMGINKEKFLNSLMEPSPPTTNVLDSPFKSSAKEKFFSSMVDSPISSLSKDFDKLKLSDNNSSSTPTGKGDNLARNGGTTRGSGGGVDGCASVSSGGGVDDAFHGDDQNTTEELNTNEFSSLKGENDKIKQQQVNNEIQSNSNATATADAVINTAVSQAHEATVKAHGAHSSSDLSDGEDDGEYGIPTTKRITRTALDNIAKAGTTQQFKFSTTTTHSSAPINSTSTTATTLAGKQIGVIRPLLNTSTTSASPTNNTIQKVLTTDLNMETLKHSTPSPSLTSREIEKNRINDLKKSSSTSSMSPSSSPSTSLENVIKATNATTNSSSSSNTSSTASSASGYTEVDTVISATNNPLFAMRKRRQNPPAPPAEQTSMVFNFSNRKEVPDYIESDGVIFRRKRELPKPNESGFVLLGDLSVETSTDMDYDDFSMCPPSPCDVEFVNANIVIDGKSSIRQKSKDATFHVQFNDTLTSTFEYPSEASLIVEDSFTALGNEYPVPGDSEFNQAFQNLVLENSIMPPLHHVADEIIQLPTTTDSSTPANTTPTKNILGNLPLAVIEPSSSSCCRDSSPTPCCQYFQTCPPVVEKSFKDILKACSSHFRKLTRNLNIRLPRFREGYDINNSNHCRQERNARHSTTGNSESNSIQRQNIEHKQHQQQPQHEQQFRLSRVTKIIGNTKIAKRFETATVGTAKADSQAKETSGASEKLPDDDMDTVIFKSKYRPQSNRVNRFRETDQEAHNEYSKTPTSTIHQIA
ncbi:serine-rich adhesin for platelets isoform X3 [Stomoxys calcitrans]|uniref:serine-rich adhesin for platelets isoform X3 n=1 Tax=Stomoxys calcitrans TaxID=35570 RepID=UPI0027E23DEE|nr:serine-rich adhesin for platelets isoform X3 [Stomoxys calcitrans]